MNETIEKGVKGMTVKSWMLMIKRGEEKWLQIKKLRSNGENWILVNFIFKRQ